MFGITGPTDCHAVPGDWGNDEAPTRDEITAWHERLRLEFMAKMRAEYAARGFEFDVSFDDIDNSLHDILADSMTSDTWSSLS